MPWYLANSLRSVLEWTDSPRVQRRKKVQGCLTSASTNQLKPAGLRSCPEVHKWKQTTALPVIQKAFYFCSPRLELHPHTYVYGNGWQGSTITSHSTAREVSGKSTSWGKKTGNCICVISLTAQFLPYSAWLRNPQRWIKSCNGRPAMDSPMPVCFVLSRPHCHILGESKNHFEYWHFFVPATGLQFQGKTKGECVALQ